MTHTPSVGVGVRLPGHHRARKAVIGQELPVTVYIALYNCGP